MDSYLGAQKKGGARGTEVRGTGIGTFFSKMWHGARRKTAAELIAKADSFRKRADRLGEIGTINDMFDAIFLYDNAKRLYKKAAGRTKEPNEARLGLAYCNLAAGGCYDLLGLERNARIECQRAIENVVILLSTQDPDNRVALAISRSANDYLKQTGSAGSTEELIGAAREIGRLSTGGRKFPFSLS